MGSRILRNVGYSIGGMLVICSPELYMLYSSSNWATKHTHNTNPQAEKDRLEEQPPSELPKLASNERKDLARDAQKEASKFCGFIHLKNADQKEGKEQDVKDVKSELREELGGGFRNGMRKSLHRDCMDGYCKLQDRKEMIRGTLHAIYTNDCKDGSCIPVVRSDITCWEHLYGILLIGTEKEERRSRWSSWMWKS